MLKSKSCIIQILYITLNRRFTRGEWEKKFRYLPEQTQIRIMKYRRWQDRQAKMLGYHLLQEGLRGYGYALKFDVPVDHFGRPYVDHGVDFNISHSDGCVVCALTSEGRLGIDIEKIKPINFTDFEDCMSSVEWKEIKASKNMSTSFYDFWTIKESTLKADGRGLSLPLEKVETHGNKAKLDGRTWFLTRLELSPGFSCHLACDMQDKQLEITELHS